MFHAVSGLPKSLVLAALLAEGAAISSFTVTQNMAAGLSALIATVFVLWRIVKWVDSRVAEQLLVHNARIESRLALQDLTSKGNQELLLEKIHNISQKLSHMYTSNRDQG